MRKRPILAPFLVLRQGNLSHVRVSEGQAATDPKWELPDYSRVEKIKNPELMLKEQMCKKLNQADVDGALAEVIFRLRRFVEDSDLSFYQIASSLGIPSTILSMWLAGTAKARRERIIPD